MGSTDVATRVPERPGIPRGLRAFKTHAAPWQMRDRHAVPAPIPGASRGYGGSRVFGTIPCPAHQDLLIVIIWAADSRHSRFRGNPGLSASDFCIDAKGLWVPAFAGMTLKTKRPGPAHCPRTYARDLVFGCTTVEPPRFLSIPSQQSRGIVPALGRGLRQFPGARILVICPHR